MTKTFQLRAPLALLAATCLLALLAPTAAAHAAPPPRAFETRVLHDHNDDSAVVLAGKHGFDAIALDVREARFATGEDALVLRLLLNGGCNENVPTSCPTLRHVVRFEAPAGMQEIAFETADGGLSWTGTAARYGLPEPLNDGTRFAIEGWVPFASFDGSVRTALEGWFVEGYEGEQSADDMPAGAAADLPDPLGAAFNIGSYALRARDYVRLDAGMHNATGVAGATVEVPLKLANAVALAQNATLTVEGPATLGSGGSQVSTLALAPNFTAELTLAITLPNGTSPVTVTIATPLGGFANLTIQASGLAPQPTIVNETVDDHAHTEEKDAPGVTPILGVAVLVLAVALQRRRGR